MKALLLALLLPALSFAAGYPPGSYSFTGLVEPDWLAPNGFDFSLDFTWDGGNVPETVIPNTNSDPPIVIPGSLQGVWAMHVREGGCCSGDWYRFKDMFNPDGFAMDIENGLLNGFLIMVYGAGDPLFLEVDFETGDFTSIMVYRGGAGTLNRAPGYIEDPLLTPEPATWTLLLLGVAGILRKVNAEPRCC